MAEENFNAGNADINNITITTGGGAVDEYEPGMADEAVPGFLCGEVRRGLCSPPSGELVGAHPTLPILATK